MKQTPYVAQCPSCAARLPINEEQMLQAQGNVRCANCDEVFYAPDQLLKGFYSKTAKGQGDDELLFLPDEQQPVELAPEAVSGQDYQQHEMQQQRSDALVDEDEQQQMSTSGFRYEEDPSASIASSPMQSAGNAQHNRAVPQTMSDELNSNSPSSWLWWVGCLILIGTISFTIVLAEFDDWSRESMMRGVYAKLCPLVDCELPRDMPPVLMKISAVGQKQLSAGAYRIKGVILNQAYFTQPLPVIKLEFIDLQDNVQGSRIFKPDEYSNNLKPLLPSAGQPFTLDVELINPVQFRLIPRFSLVSY